MSEHFDPCDDCDGTVDWVDGLAYCSSCNYCIDLNRDGSIDWSRFSTHKPGRVATTIALKNATIAQQAETIRTLRAALERIAVRPCDGLFGGPFTGERVTNCIDFQEYIAKHPETWPDDYVASVVSGRYLCCGCLAAISLDATREPS